MTVSVLPAFNAIDGNGSFGLVPDPDGHSVWVIANTDFQGVTLPDIYSAPQTYSIVKIDLNTNTVVNQWQYAYGSYNTSASNSGPVDAAVGTSNVPLYEPIMWFDADGFLYTGVPFSSAHPNSTIAKNNPNSAFALSGMFGQPGFRNHVNYVPAPLTWKVLTHSAKQYAACICPIGTGGINLLVILNLTDMLIVGNWWNTSVGTVDVFIDASGTIWAVSIDGSGNMQLDGWNFSDGTTAQPTNPYGFLDPFLAVSQTRTVPWARFSSVGGGSGLGIGAIRYLSATNQLVTATRFNSPPLSGDIAIINLSDLSQAAFLPNSNYYSIFGGTSLYSCFRDSGAGVLGPANSNIIVPGQFEPVPNPEVGSLLSIYDGSLTLLNSYRMSQLIRAADPIALANLNGLHTDSFGPYFPGDMILQSDFSTILIADSGGALTITVNAGSVIPGTVLRWRGVYDPAVTYNLNDVVARSSTGSFSSVSFFTAMATSTGVDPFFASSATWMPNIQQTQVSGTWTSPASEPLGPVLYFQTLQKIVFQFYPGSSTYVLSLSSVPPPPPPPPVSPDDFLTYIYDFPTKSWARIQRGFSSLGVFEMNEGEQILVGGGTDGYVYVIDDQNSLYSTAGTLPVSTFRPALINFGDDGAAHRFVSLELEFSSAVLAQDITATFWLDPNDVDNPGTGRTLIFKPIIGANRYIAFPDTGTNQGGAVCQRMLLDITAKSSVNSGVLRGVKLVAETVEGILPKTSPNV